MYPAISAMATPVPLFFSSPAFHYSSSNHGIRFSKQRLTPGNPNFHTCCSLKVVGEKDAKREYSLGVVDTVFLRVFRQKMVQEVGWDSEKSGYDGLIDVATRLMKARSNSETRAAAVRILRSLFPPLLLELYQTLIAPLGGGKIAAVMVARVTALSCQWLMGPCAVNSVNLQDGTSWNSGVYVEKCKYLEESKCVGICLNTCKFPTQTFFSESMGVPLLMEPNFNDYSCQFKFGVIAPQPEDDVILKEPCLEISPNSKGRKEKISRDIRTGKCPQA